VSQERFSYSCGDDGTRWQVPLMVRAGLAGAGETRIKTLLTEDRATIDLGGKADWVVVNDGAWGFYRVRYETSLLRRITVDMQTNLGPLERLSLVSDTWAAVLAGRSPVADYVELTRMLGDETDPEVWAAILAPYRAMARVLGDDDLVHLQAFVRDLVRPAFERLGWEPVAGEPERTGTLRATLVHGLGALGADETTRRIAKELHEAYLADRSAVVPDLVDPVVGIVAAAGTEADYDAFVDRFQHPANPQEEVRYLYALGRFEDTALVQRTLALALSGEVRTQNAPYLIGIVLANRGGPDVAWSFLEEHWDEINARFPSNSLSRMVEGIAVQADPGLAARARAFLDAHPVPSATLLVRQTLERLDVNVAFARSQGRAIVPALRD